jgi:hypothetical protein
MSMRTVGLWLLLLCGISLHQAALADASEVTDVVRCIFVGLEAAQSPDPARQQGAVVVAMYFLGRLDSLMPQANLEDLLNKESAAMNKPSVFQAEANRCGLTLKEKGRMMQQVGNRLMLRDEETQQNPSSPLP